MFRGLNAIERGGTYLSRGNSERIRFPLQLQNKRVNVDHEIVAPFDVPPDILGAFIELRSYPYHNERRIAIPAAK